MSRSKWYDADIESVLSLSVTQLMQVRTKKLLQLVNAEGRLAVHCLPLGSPPQFINLCFRLLNFGILPSIQVRHELSGTSLLSIWIRSLMLLGYL
jgi:hypothetical protein